MPAALFFQFVSLLASVAMVPLLLGTLGTQQYLLWTVFTTAGGLTLQLENAIQTLMVRRIAPLHAARDGQALRREQMRATRAYRLLAASILLLMLPAGWLYIDRFASDGVSLWGSSGWGLAWLFFAVGYGINYLFGANNVLLLGTARTDSYYWASSASRIVNILLTASALLLGFQLLGVSLSFFLSVAVNVLAILLLANAARRVLFAGTRPESPAAASADFARTTDEAGIFRYAAFTFAAFLLYRGAFLLVVGRLAADAAAAYGLALQAFAIAGAVALLPLQVWLHRLAEAMHRGDHRRQRREILLALTFAILTMVCGTFALQFIGPPLLQAIGSEVELPPFSTLALMGTAFLIEALIMVFVNPLLLAKDLSFIPVYLGVAATALATAIVASALGAPLAVAMLLLPLLLQGLITLPLLAVRAARTLGRQTAINTDRLDG